MPTFDQGNSPRWRIFDAVATALETAPELQGVPVKRNPTSAIALKAGEYTLMVRWNGDSLQGGNAMFENRRFTLVVGSLVATRTSDRDADAMHQVASAVLRRTMPTLNAIDGVKELNIRETDVTPFAEDFAPVDGGLVLSAYEIAYRQPTFGQQR